jgi:integrase
MGGAAGAGGPGVRAGLQPGGRRLPPKTRRYANATTLTESESRALLEVFKADDSLLSRRDYAFLLSRLRLGVKNKLLIELRWGQIELREGRAWVEWAPGAAPPSYRMKFGRPSWITCMPAGDWGETDRKAA